ncbi:hypothetical protein G6F68_011620 [Rhizopus microsporus]|nr:hypothetical protein G6F68_011620 [Rhizopus microsporus]
MQRAETSRRDTLSIMVTPARFERATFPLGGGRSIQLSYGAMQPGSLQATRPALQAFMFHPAALARVCMSSELLKSLGLDAINAGTYLGNGEWSSATSGELITPVNPTTGEPIAQVRATTEAEYDTVVARAQEAFKVWRTTPAPRRGEAVRLCGEALRKHKDALGSLVALEMGKSKPEGDGEVQEMIDIADFAGGQSRMLYGYTMHSERPGHRMYEQYHPLGLLEFVPGRHLWRRVHLEAVQQDPADRHRLAEDLQRRAARGRLPGHLLPDQRCRYRAVGKDGR